MPALSNYLRDELARRGWTIPEFVERAERIRPGLSLSNAYLIIRDGKDNVRQDTSDLIAATLGMSPADLMILIGKGSADHDPDEVEAAALIRQLPEARRVMAKDMLRGLATTPVPLAKTPSSGRANSLDQHTRELRNGVESGEPVKRKRRQFPISVRSNRPEALVRCVLALLGLNRDSGPVALTA